MSEFTKRDLALLLPDGTPGDPVSLRHTKTNEKTEEYVAPKPKVDLSKKVARYRAGQVPEYAQFYEEDRGFVTLDSKVRDDKRPTETKTPAPRRKKIEAQILTAPKPSSEFETQESNSLVEKEESSDDEQQVVNALEDSESDSDSDDEEVARRRQRLKARVIAKEKEQEAPLEEKVEPPKKEETSPSEESESEYETDSDESEEEMMKPVFVPKNKRKTLKTQEEIEQEEAEKQQREEEKAQRKKQEAKELLAEEIRRSKEAAVDDSTTDEEMPDDTDGVDPDQEYRDWELREMRRIKRERDRAEAARKEAEETERRRNMTEEERAEEDERLRKNEPKDKSKLKFLQKYYHKGAFYMDEGSVQQKDDVRRREASGATLEDNFNKEMMPKVMQVKNFGRSGQTKYTHLADQDTSTKDALWSRKDSIRDKYERKMGGIGDLEKPRKKRKKE